MFKEKTFVVILFCSILTLSSVVLQYLNPTQSFLDGGLITAIMLTVLVKEDFYTKILSGISIFFVIGTAF